MIHGQIDQNFFSIVAALRSDNCFFSLFYTKLHSSPVCLKKKTFLLLHVFVVKHEYPKRQCSN
jgi:hypothetical protein